MEDVFRLETVKFPQCPLHNYRFFLPIYHNLLCHTKLLTRSSTIY